MDSNDAVLHHDEQIIEHEISNLTLEGSLVHINDQAGRLANEQRNDAPESDTLMIAIPSDTAFTSLYDRAQSLITGFTQSGRCEDLEEAMGLLRHALKVVPASHPHRPKCVSRLAVALSIRFQLFGRRDDMEEAILVHRQAHELVSASDPYRSTFLHNLSKALRTRFIQLGRLEDLEEAIVFDRQALELLPASRLDRCNFVETLATSLWMRFQQLDRRNDLEDAILLHRQALELKPGPHPDRWTSLNHLALALRTQFQRLGRPEALEEAVLLHRQALELLPPCHSNRPASLANLALALSTQFEKLGRREDLEEAILLHRRGLELLPAFYLDRPQCLNNLANALMKNFEQLSRREDLEEAILLCRQAIELLSASYHDRSTSLDQLAHALQTRFRHFNRRDDLEEAILFHRQALDLLPASHPSRSGRLSSLACALSMRFAESGGCNDIEEAILLHRQALELMVVESDSDRSTLLHNFALALMQQFDQLGLPEDLEEAILCCRQALELPNASHHSRCLALTNLGSALMKKFQLSSQCDDLEEAILLHRQALELIPAFHFHRHVILMNLASALSARFSDFGRRDDLKEAILLHRHALGLLSTSYFDRFKHLNNLANALKIEFSLSGLCENLEEAILLHRQALELLPASHPDRSALLSNLASALRRQFEQFDRREDLQEATFLHRQALALIPSSHAERSKFLSNLAQSLRIQFTKFGGEQEDLDESILLHRHALELRPGLHNGRFASLFELSCSLWTKFKLLGRSEDLEEAISSQRQALELVSASSTDRPGVLAHLALILRTRFDNFGRFEDLEEAIDLSHQSLDALPSGDPSTCLLSNIQGVILLAAYSHTDELKYLYKAMDFLEAAARCETAPVSLRFRVARTWASVAELLGHDSALDAYQTAIQLLHRLTMFSVDLPSRQRALTSGSDGLARDAAACAIQIGEYDKAVELLEEGRAIFWSQALQLRTPLTALHDMNPELAGKLRRISVALEQGSLQDFSMRLSDDVHTVIPMEREASHFRHLNDEWLETLEEVRQLEDFGDFLLPSKISKLLAAAATFPLVILNASESGCAALILTSNSVQHVPFQDFTFADVTQLVELVQNTVAPGKRDVAESIQPDPDGIVDQMLAIPDTLRRLRQPLEDRHMTRRVLNISKEPDDVFRDVLGVLWKSVVKPVTRQLSLEKTDLPSNLRWCPTGAFVFLPIHAAGIYGTKESECIYDYAISSYTPTISALLRDTPSLPTPFKMVVVIGPDLRYAVDELQRIRARVPVTEAQAPVTEVVRLGSVEEVISHLPTTSIAHFACHGTQKAHQPLASALILQDRSLTVYRIMQQSSPNAMLAFLAACQTAMGDKGLPDEVIHLGSTLLFAGFPGVIATMWNISDVDGPGVADAFYEYLFNGTNTETPDNFQPDTTRAARALHFAVAKLRSKGVSFARWVPFIHLGR